MSVRTTSVNNSGLNPGLTSICTYPISTVTELLDSSDYLSISNENQSVDVVKLVSVDSAFRSQ